MTMRHVLAFVAFLSLAGAQPAQMTITTLDRGDHSQIGEPRELVVRAADEWAALWKEHGGEGKPPAVDLSRSMVIGVFLGTRRTAGYDVEITRVAKQGTGLVVTYGEKGPGKGDMVAQMLTAPFHIVRTDAHAGQVTFRRVP